MCRDLLLYDDAISDRAIPQLIHAVHVMMDAVKTRN